MVLVAVSPVGVGSPACSPACSQQREDRCNCSSAAPCEEEEDCPGSALSCRPRGPDNERMRMVETTREGVITGSCLGWLCLSALGEGVGVEWESS